MNMAVNNNIRMCVCIQVEREGSRIARPMQKEFPRSIFYPVQQNKSFVALCTYICM